MLNVVVLTAALSVYNSGVYSNTRMLYGLARRPAARTAQCDRRGVPLVALGVSALATGICVVVNYFMPGKAFGFLMGLVVSALIINWALISWIHLRFRAPSWQPNSLASSAAWATLHQLPVPGLPAGHPGGDVPDAGSATVRLSDSILAGSAGTGLPPARQAGGGARGLSGKARPYRSLYCYPWDVASAAQHGQRLQQLGMNGVTLAVSYHAGKFLRPHGRRRPARHFSRRRRGVFRTAARAIWRTQAASPFRSAMRRVLPELVADAQLAVHAWTVLLHNSRLGALHPHTAHNVFGDGYVYSLCPMHDAVFAYAVNLCRDIAAQGVHSLVLETPGWLPYAHGYHHEFAQVRSNVWLDTMLGLCFCDACMAAGRQHGLGMDSLRASIARSVDQYLQAPVDATPAQAQAWLQADLLAMPALAEWLRLRQRRVTELVGAIRAAIPPQVELAVIATVQRPTASNWLEGMDVAALARVADWIEVPFYEADAAAVASDAWDCIRRLGGSAQLRAILRPGPPDLADGAQLASALDRLAQLGIRELGFYNFGLLRPARLEALGQALRPLPDEPASPA
jgi:hypothetical protein